MARFLLLATLLSISIPQLFISGVISRTFTIANECNYTVCPGILNDGGSAELSTTGFTLQKGHSKNLTLPPSWTGRIWGRTLCAQNSTGQFSCVTGDCGSGKVECAGSGAAPPISLAEFSMNVTSGQDFYDVSFVDGFNLPLMVVPQGGKGGKCNSTGCDVDLNGACPNEMKVTVENGTESVACRSPCDAFRTPQYCCTGAYNSASTCKPNSYTELFKNACSSVYSYAFDDATSTFTCGASPDYLITFCPFSSKTSSETLGPISPPNTGNATAHSTCIN